MAVSSEEIKEGEIIRNRFVNGKTFFCDQCSFQSELQFDVLTHKQNRHEQIQQNHNEHQGFSYNCSKCDHQTISKAIFSTHAIRDHVFNCKKCPKTFIFLEGLYYHTVYIHKKYDKVRFKCTICDHRTNSKTGLSTHTNRDHEFLCKNCPGKFISKLRLYFHNKYTHEQDCNNIFDNKCDRCDY